MGSVRVFSVCSDKMPIRQFMQRVQQLNDYLDLLPCLFYSEHATKLTKEVEPFDDADLVSHILRMVPKHWQTSASSRAVLYPRAFASYSKHLSASKRPSQPRKAQRA